MVGDQVNGVPHFFGAEPATVLEGPHAGLRALPREEDLARELMLALQEDQRRMARIAVKAPADIASRWDPVAALPEQPRGVPYARLDRLQRELFVSLLRQYVDRAASAVANQAWTDITDAGLDQVCLGGPGRSSEAPATITRSAVRACSSSTTTPRTGPITSTPCGATCAATSPGPAGPALRGRAPLIGPLAAQARSRRVAGRSADPTAGTAASRSANVPRTANSVSLSSARTWRFDR